MFFFLQIAVKNTTLNHKKEIEPSPNATITKDPVDPSAPLPLPVVKAETITTATTTCTTRITITTAAPATTTTTTTTTTAALTLENSRPTSPRKPDWNPERERERDHARRDHARDRCKLPRKNSKKVGSYFPVALSQNYFNLLFVAN